MKPRGLLTPLAIGLVVAVALLALADTLRGLGNDEPSRAQPPAEPATTVSTTGESGAEPRPEAPDGWPEGELDGVLTFVDANDCRIRVIGLSGGRERPLPDFPTNCGAFSAPVASARVAYAEGGLVRLADLYQPQRDYGAYKMAGLPVWSLDGQRAAWCAGRGGRRGVEIEFLGQTRRLAFCPIAYTPQGNLAHLEGRNVVIGGQVAAKAPAGTTTVAFGIDENSVAVALEDGRIFRQTGAGSVVAEVPPGWTGSPIFTLDTCLAAIPLTFGVTVASLGCDGGDVTYEEFRTPGPSRSAGGVAAFSPDGAWVAIAEPDAIVFHSLDASEPELQIRWPARAVALAWRP